MNYETFGTERNARARLRQLIGWPNKALEQIYLPDDKNADADGNVWVITPAEGQYLRSDGYVR